MSTTAQRILEALMPLQLKKEGANQYRSNSPLRPGSDSRSFTLTLEGDEHGAFHDHVSGESGSLYELAARMGIPVPTSVPVENSKRGYDGIEDYARAHGVSGDVLRQWHWRETDYLGRPALEFMTETGRRWRFIDGVKGKPVYTSEPGYKRSWYGLTAKLGMMLLNGQPLVLCNGEISTIAARFHGVAATAMTSGEKGEIPVDLLEQLKGFLSKVPNPKIIVAMDCDKTGRAAARGLEAQLRTEGFDARAVDLGLGQGGDLADFCKLYTGEAAKRLIDAPGLPAAVEHSKWKFASIDDLLKMGSIDWLIPRQIPSRGLCMLYGASGTYKSFFILDHAMRLALNGVNVLYIAAEGEYGYRQRVEAWMQHYQLKPQQITFVLGQVDFFDVEERDEFARTIEMYKPKMIVVDTFAMCSGVADENAARDMLQIVNGCKAMIRQFEAVIVVVHHTNAEGKKERGSKVLRNACDTIIRLSHADDRLVVESQKTKDTKPFDAYYLAPINVELGYKNNIGETVSSVVLLPAEKVMRADQPSALQSKVLGILATEPNATIAEIASAVECDSVASVSSAIRELKKKGYLTLAADGKRSITDVAEMYIDNMGRSNDQSDQSDQSTFQKRDSQKPVDRVDRLDPLIADDELPGFKDVQKKRQRRDQYKDGA